MLLTEPVETTVVVISSGETEEPIESVEATTNNEECEMVEVSREVISEVNTRICYNNGDVYEGELEGDLKSGWGTYLYSNGEKYIGCFIDD